MNGQDFSTDVGDWGGFPPGDGNVVRNPGDNTANVFGTAYTKYGGYRNVWPAWGYSTSIDVFVNVAATGDWHFSSAANGSDGNHQRDFAFHAGLGGAGEWHVSASTGGTGDPSAVGHATITSSGWYTFSHNFHANGPLLEVTMEIHDSSGALVGSFTLGNDPIDVIATELGGNRYGWFVGRTVADLKIDNVTLYDNAPPADSGPAGAVPLSTFEDAVIQGSFMGGFRIALGCSTGAPSGHEAVDAVEISIDNGAPTVYDFEHH